MKHSKALHGVLRILLLFFSLVGTAAGGVYWFAFREQETDWRVFAVGLLLSVVLGWWPWISLATGAVLATAAVVVGPDGMRMQVAGEILGFWILGLGWGTLARWQFHFVPPSDPRIHHLPPPPAANRPVSPRAADADAFRSRRLMEGEIEEPGRQEPPAPRHAPSPVDLGWTPKLSEAPAATAPLPLPSLEGMPLTAPPLAKVELPKPPPRPPATPSLAEYGGESLYLGSLPDISRAASATGESSHPAIPEFPKQTGPMSAPPSAAGVPPRTAEESSVFIAPEYPTMELPVNTLLRPPQPRSTRSPPSSAGPISTSGPASASSESSGDGMGTRRSSAFRHPETTPGASWEHVLEWYNQFSWSPWPAEELQRRYYRPGIQVGWESLALQDLAAAWKLWRHGCVPLELEPDQIDVRALEGFLRCEELGVLRHQGFPDLHILSRAEAGDGWLAVYREVRGRMRGGEATIHRVDAGTPLVDAETGLVGRPDRLAEIRGESDVVALVTPFSVNEGLNWTTVYALAQYRLAHALGQVLSGTPVVVNLPLPIWDERKQSRLATVDDIGSERRRLDVALERFRRVLSGQASPRPQTHAGTCSGCGWRHACPSYQGTRPRLDLSDPPPQIAAALR
jgi:hypothetical protein